MILERVDGLHFVTQERVCDQPKVVMDTLCERIGLNSAGFDLTQLFHPIAHRAEGEVFDARRMAVATDIYRALRRLPNLRQASEACLLQQPTIATDWAPTRM